MIRQAMRGNARKKRERKWVENGIRFRTQDLVTAWNNNELKLYVAFCTLFLLSCSQPIIEDAVSRFSSISRKKWLPLQAIRCVTVFFFQCYQRTVYQINSPKSLPCRWPDQLFRRYLVSILLRESSLDFRDSACAKNLEKPVHYRLESKAESRGRFHHFIS